ncbi:MAG TPA: metallophosphoesterase family protein [Candidatus Limnocylindria bacterium]|nr:metallophosphoesterase family protein [Candidatus Limnocylindria bacterium]
MRLGAMATALALALVLILPASGQEGGDTLELLPRGAVWHYSDAAEDLGRGWQRRAEYRAWDIGAAPLGFGDEVSGGELGVALATEIGYGGCRSDKAMTTYFVTAFDAPDLRGYAGVAFYVNADDGLILYLNGEEIYRKAMPRGRVNYGTRAVDKVGEEIFFLPMDRLRALRGGENLLQAEVHQVSPRSSDLWFELGMIALRERPGRQGFAWPRTAPDLDVPSRLVMTIGEDPQTSMAFTWYTGWEGAAPDLQVAPSTSSGVADFAAGMAFPGFSMEPRNAPGYLVHKAEATGLAPGGTYHFRAGDAARDAWSETGSFTLDDGDGAFTFLSVAETQAGTPGEARLAAGVMAAAAQAVPEAAFILHSGDVVDNAGREQEWGWFADAAEGTLLRLPVMAAPGNHDADSMAFIDHFNLSPGAGSDMETGVHYSFDYGSSHFMVLNTNDDSGSYDYFSSRQMEWLRRDAARASQRGAQWLIVLTHRGPYTTGPHADSKRISGEDGLRRKVAPALAELGVDLVVQGHDHIYSLSKPIGASGEAAEPQVLAGEYKGLDVPYMVNPEGVVYVNPGSAGAKVYGLNSAILEDDPGYFDKFLWAREHTAEAYAESGEEPPRGLVQNFVDINVTPGMLSAVVYEIDRSLGDAPYVLDTFGIVKR